MRRRKYRLIKEITQWILKERNLLFEKNRGSDWPEEYKIYRDKWLKFAKEKLFLTTLFL